MSAAQAEMRQACTVPLVRAVPSRGAMPPEPAAIVRHERLAVESGHCSCRCNQCSVANIQQRPQSFYISYCPVALPSGPSVASPSASWPGSQFDDFGFKGSCFVDDSYPYKHTMAAICPGGRDVCSAARGAVFDICRSTPDAPG